MFLCKRVAQVANPLAFARNGILLLTWTLLHQAIAGIIYFLQRPYFPGTALLCHFDIGRAATFESLKLILQL